MHDTNDIEDALVKDRNPRKTLPPHHFDRAGNCSLLRHRFNLHQRHHCLACLGAGEAKDAANHPLFFRHNHVARWLR